MTDPHLGSDLEWMNNLDRLTCVTGKRGRLPENFRSRRKDLIHQLRPSDVRDRFQKVSDVYMSSDDLVRVVKHRSFNDEEIAPWYLGLGKVT